VKVRGFRIELGEIEAALQSHPAVASAVVTARSESAAASGVAGSSGSGADARLTAYLVTRAEAVSREELNAHLMRALPVYMLPAAYVFLDKLPLTPHGKVDRNALPPPGSVLRNGPPEQATAPGHRPPARTRMVTELAEDEVDALLATLLSTPAGGDRPMDSHGESRGGDPGGPVSPAPTSSWSTTSASTRSGAPAGSCLPGGARPTSPGPRTTASATSRRSGPTCVHSACGNTWMAER
jgi:hypothetical protein